MLCYGSPRKQIHSRTELWGCWPSPPHLHPWVVLPVDHAERITSVVLSPAPAAVQHLRAAAGVLCRCVRAEPSQQCCLSCQTGCRTTASEALAGALAMANLSSYTSRLPEPPLQLFSCLDGEAAVKGCPWLSSPFSSCQALWGAPLPPEDPQIQSLHDSIPPPPASTRAFCTRVGSSPLCHRGWAFHGCSSICEMA